MQVEVFDIRKLSEADLLAIAELLVEVWPKSGKTVQIRRQQQIDLGRQFPESSERFPYSLLVRGEDRVIAHACLVPRTIGTSAGDITIAGLAKVCTNPRRRQKGLGAMVVRAVFDLVERENYPFSLFQTTDEVRPFYDKLGACTVSNRFTNSLGDNPNETPFWDKVIMRYPTGDGWPEGEIDMRGPGY